MANTLICSLDDVTGNVAELKCLMQFSYDTVHRQVVTLKPITEREENT